jgi:GAF domain-containing protein
MNDNETDQNDQEESRATIDFEMLHQVLSGGPQEAFLQDLTMRAVGVLDGADSASVMLRKDGDTVTVASSDELGRQLEKQQFEAGAGPCLDSLADGIEQTSPDLAHEGRWGAFPSYALELGAQATLAMPLLSDGQCFGALNLYARKAYALPADLSTARQLAAQAGGATAVAERIARQMQETADLRAALESRSVIDQAVGIVMARQRIDAEHALAVLRRASQNRNIKLRQLAAELVTSVGGRPPEPRNSFHPRED